MEEDSGLGSVCGSYVVCGGVGGVEGVVLPELPWTARICSSDGLIEAAIEDGRRP